MGQAAAGALGEAAVGVLGAGARAAGLGPGLRVGAPPLVVEGGAAAAAATGGTDVPCLPAFRVHYLWSDGTAASSGVTCPLHVERQHRGAMPCS